MVGKREDFQAKSILAEKWPARPREIFPAEDGRNWLRAQPALTKGATHPRIVSPGSERLKTQPDGLYCIIGRKSVYADVIVIEVCSSEQNMHDKRSRYSPSTSALCLDVRRSWLRSEVRGGSTVWEYLGAFEVEPVDDLIIPIRHLSLICAISDEIFERINKSICPQGHEFFMPIKSLNSINGKQMRQFLSSALRKAHFYGNVKFKKSKSGATIIVNDADADGAESA